MFKTVIMIGILIASVLWLPLWVQIVGYSVAVIMVPYRIALFVPAVFSDVLYAPTDALSLEHIKMILIVSVLILVHWFITTTVRTTHTYDLETK